MRIMESAIASSINAIGITDFQAKVIYVNDSLVKMWGFDSSDEILGRFLPEFWEGEGIYNTIESLHEQRGVVGEDIGKRKDGSLFTTQFSASMIKDDAGNPLYMLGSFVDVTDHKQREEDLRSSEERFRSVYETAPLAFIIWDRDTKVIDWNEKAEELFGWSKKEAVGRSFFEFIIPDKDRPHVEAVVASLLNGELPSHSTNNNLTKDAKVITCQWNNSILHDEQGNVTGAISLALDITERKRAEEALRASEERYRALADNLPVGLFRNTPGRKGRFLVANRAIARMFGFDSVESFIQTSVADLYADPKQRQTFSDKIISAGSVANQELLLRKNDGGHFWGSVTADAIRSESGEIECFEGIIEDITERKLAEEETRKLVAIVRHSSELVNLASMDGMMIFINEAGGRMLGIDPDKVERVNIMEVIPDHLIELVENELLPTLISGDTWEGDLQYRNLLTGKLTDVHAIAFTVKDPGTGEPIFLANVSLDITVRKRAEEAVRSSEERYRHLVENSFDGIFIQKGAKIIFANQQLYGMLGYEPGELDGLDHWLVYNPEYQELTRSRAQARLRGELPPSRYEVKLQRKDGTSFDGEVSARAFTIDGELGIQVWVRDITERKRVEEALKENERWLKTILDSIQAAVIVHGPDTGLVLVNPKARELLGQTEKLLIEKDAHDPEWRFTREDGTPLRIDEYPVNRVLAKSGPLRDYVGGIVRPDNQETTWVTLNADPIFDDQGNISQVIVTFMDITDRKKAEDELRVEKERFQVLNDESPLGISLVGPDGRYEYVNPSFVQMFGYDLDDVPEGREWFRRAYPDSDYRRHVVSTWLEDREMAEVGEARPRTFTVTCKDGSEKEVHFRPVSLEEGSQLVIYEDITERKRAEQRLIDSEKRYRDLFNNVNDFIFTHDMEGRFLTVNPVSARIVGYLPEEMTGRPIGDFMLPQHRQAFQAEYLPEIKRQRVFNGVSIYLAKDGTRRYIEYRNNLVQPEGQEPYVSGVGRDVTDRVLAERDLKEMEARLAHAQKMEAVGT
ncbi:MAG: PAS domain S-box protein, partial [Proteobacteria bacterium]|nr:PAS domain S-box protein [Pseudomonadota bacterium]